MNEVGDRATAFLLRLPAGYLTHGQSSQGRLPYFERSSVEDGVVRVADTFFVPVRESIAGTLALQTGRLRSGERVGLAFTTEASLLLTMGPSRRWVRLGGQALRDMLAPLGVRHIRVDPEPLRSGYAGRLLMPAAAQRGAA